MSIVHTHFFDFYHELLFLPGKSAARKPRTPHFFSLGSSEDLSVILRRPYELFVEIGERIHLEEAIARLTSDAPDFALSLTTTSVYRNDIASAVTAILNDRFGLSDSAKTGVKTSLHEALINAVVHGNLGLESQIKSLEDFDSYYAAIEERIGKALYKNRRINIAAWDRNQNLELRVSDEGPGFTHSGAPENNFPHAHGLFFIQSLTDSMHIADDGRSLCMTFRHS